MIAVFDTNIVIDALNGLPEADSEYGRYERVLISRVTWMEVLVGALIVSVCPMPLFGQLRRQTKPFSSRAIPKILTPRGKVSAFPTRFDAEIRSNSHGRSRRMSSRVGRN